MPTLRAALVPIWAGLAGLVVALGAIVAACGGGEPSADPLDALRDVTPVEAGTPVLVFVFTDG